MRRLTGQGDETARDCLRRPGNPGHHTRHLVPASERQIRRAGEYPGFLLNGLG